jgi:hypothetical protein
MMFLHKCWQLFRAVKWHKQVRQAISTQLSLLEHPSVFALGGLTEAEEETLATLAKAAACQPGPIIEFGTLFGLTTRLLASVAAADQFVMTVDNFSWNPFGLPPQLHQSFTQKVLRTELMSGRVGLRVMSSEEFRDTYTGPKPAMVFLDADHSYAAVRDEIAWAKRLGAGVIAGHDYGNKRFGVTRAVDEAFPTGLAVRGAIWSWKGRP